MKPILFFLLVITSSLQAMDADEIRKIAKEPHDRKNLLPELEIYPEAREYKVRVFMGAKGQPMQQGPEFTVKEKVVKGRYVVSEFQLPQLPLLMVVTYDSESAVYRKWVLQPNDEVVVSIGVANRKTGTMAWSSDVSKPEPVRVLGIETHGEKRSTWKETIIKDGEVVARSSGVAVKIR